MMGRKYQRGMFSAPCEIMYKNRQVGTLKYHAREKEQEENPNQLVQQTGMSDQKSYDWRDLKVSAVLQARMNVLNPVFVSLIDLTDSRVWM